MVSAICRKIIPPDGAFGSENSPAKRTCELSHSPFVDLRRVDGSGRDEFPSSMATQVREVLSADTTLSSEVEAVDLRYGLVARSQTVGAGTARYRVQMTVGGLEACSEILHQAIGNEMALIVTTPTVARLYAGELFQLLQGSNHAVRMMILNCAEALKTVD